MIGSDPAAVEGVKVSRTVLVRVWRFAAPYRGAIFGFLAVIVVSSLLSLAPPLLFRQILDVAIPNADRSQLNKLAALIVAAALSDALLALV
jgi:ATP-binding cassette, subfamily B, bacterial